MSREQRAKSEKFPRGNGRNLLVSLIHGCSFMTMLPDSGHVNQFMPSHGAFHHRAALIYLCAAFIFCQFVSFDFIARALLENVAATNFILMHR